MRKMIFLILIFIASNSIAQIGWYQQSTATSNDLTSITGGFIYKYAAGRNGTILRSQYWGSNWITQNSGTSLDINKIGYIRYPKLLALSNNGNILRNDTSNAVWSLSNTGFDKNLKDFFTPYVGSLGNRCIIICDDGLVIKSTNDGETWVQCKSNTFDNLNSISKTTQDLLFAVGENGTIIKSTDYGDNWAEINTPFNDNLIGIYFTHPSTIVVASKSGRIMKSINNGSTWNIVFHNSSLVINTLSNSRGSGTCTSVLWVGCNNGIILKSTNLGDTWFNDYSNTTQNIYSITGGDCSEAFAAGANGLILHSTISGASISFSDLNPNRIFSPLSNIGSIHQNGDLHFRWREGGTPFYFHDIYSSGLYLAARVNNQRRLAISKYSTTEYYPGQIDFNSQMPYGKNDTSYRIYKVHPDFPNGNTIYDSWNNWPINQGAPWVDVNGNGIYEPPVDHPVMKGIENLFCVFTDGYPESHTHWNASTLPLNAEIQLYVWGRSNPPCADAIHFEWTIINKSWSNWDSMSVGLWSDPDSRNPIGDLTGCDTTLNLAYSYSYSSYAAPNSAVGFVLYDISRHSDKQMDFFFDYWKHFGPANYNEIFNAMMGLNKDGSVIMNPITNQPTKYFFSGDPETGTGWIETQSEDQQLLVGSHFGTVQPLDTIRFNVANFVTRGTSNTNSVTLLKQCANQVININQISSSTPSSFSLSQNYPNPFNPTTNIRFQIPESGFVTLKIFDITGREVATLVNEQMNAGEYNYQFSTDDYQLGSGVYFYRLTVASKNGEMNFSETKKMVLVR